MRIRTLAGPSLPRKIVTDTYRAIMLTHIANTVAVGDWEESAAMEEAW